LGESLNSLAISEAGIQRHTYSICKNKLFSSYISLQCYLQNLNVRPFIFMHFTSQVQGMLFLRNLF